MLLVHVDWPRTGRHIGGSASPLDSDVHQRYCQRRAETAVPHHRSVAICHWHFVAIHFEWVLVNADENPQINFRTKKNRNSIKLIAFIMLMHHVQSRNFMWLNSITRHFRVRQIVTCIGIYSRNEVEEQKVIAEFAFRCGIHTSIASIMRRVELTWILSVIIYVKAIQWLGQGTSQIFTSDFAWIADISDLRAQISRLEPKSTCFLFRTRTHCWFG